jgi:C-terminal processing protease CtpA/Prc
MKKKILTAEEKLKKLKKRFYIVLSLLLLFVALTGTYIFLNYDYLAFKHFITSTYIYTDALDGIFAKELNTDIKGRYYKYFDDMVISVVTKRIRDENNDRYTYLYTPESLKKYLQTEKQEAGRTELKVLDGSTLYLKLTNFSTYTRKFMQDNLQKLKSRPNIIIDLRDDPGGDIDVMADISSLFLPKKAIIATDRMRLLNIVYKSKKSKPLDYNKIIILQNGNTASASENMIAALRDNLDNVTLIGSRTYGKGIGQFTLPLRWGYAVKATVLQWYTPKGINIQGNGINPDIPYDGDDMVRFAQEKLAG